jgi:hypothetical protein
VGCIISYSFHLSFLPITTTAFARGILLPNEHGADLTRQLVDGGDERGEAQERQTLVLSRFEFLFVKRRQLLCEKQQPREHDFFVTSVYGTMYV